MELKQYKLDLCWRMVEVQYKGFQDRTGKQINVSIFNLVTGSII